MFNIDALEVSLEQDFNPNDAIRTTWFMTMGYSDGSSLKDGQSYLYDATVSLSIDEIIDAQDLTLFSLECSFPETLNHACGRFASFISQYAPGNANTFETTSIPLEKPLGLIDFSVDSTAFLDEIPKAANLIITACLQEEPKLCDEFIIGINLL